jgi:hypothetical protein
MKPASVLLKRRRMPLQALGFVVLTAFAMLALGVPSASAGTQYWLNDTDTVSTGHCYTGYGSSSYTDLLSGLPTGAASSQATGAALFGCTNPFPAGASLGKGTGTLDVWFTNTYNQARKPKSCTMPWFLQHNATPSNAGDTITGTGVNSNPGITLPPNTTSPTRLTIKFNVPATTLGPNDQLMLMIDIRTGTGPCSQMTLWYASTATPSGVSLPTLAG